MNRAPFLAFASACLLASPAVAAPSGQGEATYEVRFDATWSAATHPGAYPGGAHFSPLVGATHSNAAKLWEVGGIASPGMESMAETGATFTLSSEVNALISAGTAKELILGAGIPSPGSTTATFTVSTDFPLISLVTMVAPSPDWFVGTQSVSLLENGEWVDDLVFPLYAYDAGTDSGTSFTSPNQDTNPQEPIALITGGPFFGTVPLGTFTFTRQVSTLVYGCGVNPAGSMTVVSGTPTLGQTVTLGLDDPTGTMGTPSSTFVAVSAFADPAFPCGTALPGFGLSAPGAFGELLIGNPVFVQTGAPFTGATVAIPLTIPAQPGLVGQTAYGQGLLLDPGLRFGLTGGVEFLIGP